MRLPGQLLTLATFAAHHDDDKDGNNRGSKEVSYDDNSNCGDDDKGDSNDSGSDTCNYVNGN